MAARNHCASLLRRRPSENTKAANLNVMPVMNMFIILIPFLISMSAFVHLSAQELSLPGDDGPGQAVERDELPVTVTLGLREIKIVQGDIIINELPVLDGAYQWRSLVIGLSKQSPQRVIVAVDDAVNTSSLVSCLDAIRKTGCTEIGLAAGIGTKLLVEENK